MTTSIPTSADALIASLHEPGREHLLDLVRNPLRLTLLCMTWDGSSLPETQADLYDRYLRKMYEWNQNLHELRDHAQRCNTTITKLKQDLNRQLGELAKAALNLPQERFRLSQALVEEYLGEELDETSLGYLALRLGWLNRIGRDGRGDAIFAFYHATFQEYFAALVVEDWDYFLSRNHVDYPVEGNQYRIFEPQWKQVILLWLGRENVGEEEKETFIRALIEFKSGVRDFYGYQAYFLAAAGINEFKTCSIAAEIVRQVVKWGFGYFNIEKQEWRTFVDPVAKSARDVTGATIRQEAIDTLLQILIYSDNSNHWLVADGLETTGQSSYDAIDELIELTHTVKNENVCWWAANCLGRIDPGNSHAIFRLIQVINEATDEDTIFLAADCLGRIDPGNSHARDGLIKVIRTAQQDYTRFLSATSLEKIEPGSPHAVNGLIDLMHTGKPMCIRLYATEILKEICPENLDAIAGLIKIIQTDKDENACLQAAESLGRICPGNSYAIAKLIALVHTAKEYLIRFRAAASLGEVGQGNSDAIAGLIKVIHTDAHEAKDEFIRWQTAESLGKIDPGNPEAIVELIKLIHKAKDEDIRWWAAESLGKIDPGNSEAIAALVKVITATENEETRRKAAESLGEIDPGNSEAIAALVKAVSTTKDKDTRREAAESLGKVLTTPKQYAEVVSSLKNCLRNEVYKNNFDQFYECYKAVWNCAENLSYPDFYKAWHHSTT